jgi:hypothetical protein
MPRRFGRSNCGAGGRNGRCSIESPTDGEVFTAYVEQVLCAKLRAGDVVVLDNLSAHKVEGIRQLIEGCGAQSPFLPPYSPDLKPHRASLVQVQAMLARGQGSHRRSLGTAVSEALKTITADNAVAWFPHCDYGIQQN